MSAAPNHIPQEYAGEVATCARKRAFRTRMDAMVGMGIVMARGCSHPELLDVYQCWICARYHVGHDWSKQEEAA